MKKGDQPSDADILKDQRKNMESENHFVPEIDQQCLLIKRDREYELRSQKCQSDMILAETENQDIKKALC